MALSTFFFLRLKKSGDKYVKKLLKCSSDYPFVIYLKFDLFIHFASSLSDLYVHTKRYRKVKFKLIGLNPG